MGRSDVTAENVQEIFTKYDKNSDGKLSFAEFVDLFLHWTESRMDFGTSVAGDENQKSGKVLHGQGGAMSSYSNEEVRTYANLFNSVLAKDPYVGGRFPLDPNSDDLWHAMSDGLLFICLLNYIQKDSVDMRTVNLKKKPGDIVDIFRVKQNIS